MASLPVRAAGTSALLAAILLAPGPAWGIGVELPGTQPVDGSGHPDFPIFTNDGGPGFFDRSGNCANCHAGYRQAGEPPYEPFDSWAGSLMSMAARDPLFWAAVDIANQDDEDELGDLGVGDLCIRCHVPIGWYEGRSHCATAWGEAFDGACLEGPMTTPDNDFEGLACHFCHRIYDASNPAPDDFEDPQAPRGENAQVYLTDASDVMEGPYADAEPPGRHGFRASAFLRSAAFCGECHDVTNPARNRRDPQSGVDLGYPMPIERTWSEYRQSAFSRAGAPEETTCQGCHMPRPDLDGDGAPDAGFACKNPPGPRGENTVLEGPLRTHFFPGGGLWMQQLLMGELAAELGRLDSFQEAILRTETFLRTSAAQLDLDLPAQALRGRPADLALRVTNLTGHKLPTGYPEGRRIWIRLTVADDRDGDGRLDPAETIWESGAWDPSTGELQTDPPAKVYEVQLGIWNRNGTAECDVEDAATESKLFHFVLSDCVLLDNRIPPVGFVPNDETAPVGASYPEDPGRPGALVHWDDTSYSIPVPADATGPLLVSAEVLYQTISEEYVEFLRVQSRSTCDPFDAGCDPAVPDPRENRGEKMHRLWQSHGRAAPVTLASASAAIAVVDAPAPPPGEAGAPGTGRPLRVTGRIPTDGSLSLDFMPSCDAVDHTLLWGDLAAVSGGAWGGAACGLGTSGLAEWLPPDGSLFFVVVGNSAEAEGSYGTDSSGRERPEATGLGPCDLPRDLAATCL